MRGNKPLLFVTLPEMPFWKVVVPFPAEPVENVGSNPLRSTISWKRPQGRREGIMLSEPIRSPEEMV